MKRWTPFFIAAFVSVWSIGTAAQDQSSRVELGGQISAVRPDEFDRRMWTGMGVQVDFPVTQRVAVESRAVFFPRDEPVRYQTQGGKTFQLSTGFRGKFISSRRVSVYGVVMPGLVHFTHTTTHFENGSPLAGGATHFTVGMGGGVEIYPAPRWVAHFELSGILYSIPGAEVSRSSPGPTGAYLSLNVPGSIENPSQISAGLGYRIGGLRKRRPEQPESGRWEVGPNVSYFTSMTALGDDPRRSGGVGGFASYRLSEYIDADASIGAYLSAAEVTTPFDGGRVVQAVAGLKAGLRRDRFGIFVKARTGVNSHSRVLESLSHAPFAAPTYARSNAVALDMGAVLETYVRRHLLFRFDAGDVVSFFHSTTITVDGESVGEAAPRYTDSIQMSLGVGWKF
jgi:hypothetical protein